MNSLNEVSPVSNAVEHSDNLEDEPEEARGNDQRILQMLRQVQGELEYYFLKCQELSSAASLSSDSAMRLPVVELRRLVPLLLEATGAGELYQLAQHCKQHNHHNLALALFEAVVNRASSCDPPLAAAAQQMAVEVRLALGQVQGCEPILLAMATQDLPNPAAQHRVLQQLAGLALARADTCSAQQHLAVLAALAPDEKSAPATDQLQACLHAHENQPHPIDAATVLPQSTTSGVSLDLCRISPCGRWLRLEGWLIDPLHQAIGLALRRPGQLLLLPTEQICWHVRSDLSDLLRQHNLPANHPAGFSINLAIPEEQAVPPDPADMATLFLLQRESPAVAVSKTIDSHAPTSADLMAHLGAWMFSGHG
jgi:hypothetical protein